MARRRKLTFVVRRSLLVSGLLLGAPGCDPGEAVDDQHGDAAADLADDESYVTSNPCYFSDDDGDSQDGGRCGLDCHNGDPSVYWGAPELCDGGPNDCGDFGAPDGRDEPWYGQPCDGEDADACPDGFLNCFGGQAMCDEAANGGAVERCDGVDNDCDGQIDEDLRGCERACLASGARCDGELECCDGATSCVTIRGGELDDRRVCCLPDGQSYARVEGRARICCNADADADGVCGASR